MGGINGAREQEGEDGVVVRKMSDLPNRGLDEITIIRENFPKNEILQILNFNTGDKNELIDIIDDSPKVVVRKMSDLPNRGLDEITIIRENFPKNEIL